MDKLEIPVIPLQDFTLDELRRATVDPERDARVREATSKIIEDVRSRGDAAITEYTERFDGVCLEPSGMQVPREEIESAFRQLAPPVRDALELAANNIKKYHSRQVPVEWSMETTKGIMTGMLVRPLEKVGIYVPGGKAFYPSTVLMCAIPAKVAGVKRVVMTTPPRPDGSVNPIVLASAAIAGVDEVYRCGGAQAIAAMALGTSTIPKVDKVVGPGNAYVSMAKQLLQGDVLIDSPAGPSEVLIVASAGASPDSIAIDMCAQAEHDEDAISIAVVPTMEMASAVKEHLEELLPTLDRREIIEKSLERNGKIIVSGSEAGVVRLAEVINAIAPEHLELFLDDSTIEALLPLIKNAGAIFLGASTPVSLGDYASGTNHVLPTNGMATRFSALGALDFIKVIPWTRANAQGLRLIGESVVRIARLEGLDAHARTIEERIKNETSR